jgi:hypothetical protein
MPTSFASSSLSCVVSRFVLGIGILTALASTTFGKDITASFRSESRKMAGLLIYCGMPAQEALHIAVRKMPGATTISWWENTLLPRFPAKERALLQEQLNKYLESARTSRSASGADLMQRTILHILQQAQNLSVTDVFDLYQAGLLSQTDEWWQKQLDTVPPDKRDTVTKFRNDLVALNEKE